MSAEHLSGFGQASLMNQSAINVTPRKASLVKLAQASEASFMGSLASSSDLSFKT